MRTLFFRLDEEEVRYCVLHSWQSLPEVLTSDLDLAVDGRDREKLHRVVRSLNQDGFRLIQIFNYAVGGYYFVFVWPQEPRGIAIDFAFRHQRSLLDFGSGSELTRGRVRCKDLFWVAEPPIEFRYLLVKKMVKGSVPGHQAERLSELALQLGRADAEKIVSGLVGHNNAREIVESCLSGSLQAMLPHFARRLWWRNFLKAPGRLAQNVFRDAARRIQRFVQPTGIFVAIFGPDGAGKSTVAQNLTANFSPAFRRHKLFHWRPMLLRGSRHDGPVSNPHARAPHSAFRSALQLCYQLLDYWCGYLLRIYPQKSRSGLVIFDRYFGDVVVDPVRYRYGGPAWLARAVGRIVPRPDIAIVLDLAPEIIKSRKQEVTASEMARQREAYKQLAGYSGCNLVDASCTADDVYDAVLARVHDYLEQRVRHRNCWLTESDEVKDCGLTPDATLSSCVDRVGGGPEQGNEIRSGVVSLLNSAALKKTIRSEAALHHRRFAVLPNRRAPQLLVPIGNTEVARSALRHYPAYSNRARAAKWLLSRTAGLTKLWPADRLVIASVRRLALEELIERITSESTVELAINIGAPGRYQKMTVQVLSQAGETLGFIKLPLAAASAERIRHEAKVLKELWAHAPLRKHMPEVKYDGVWQDGYILFESALMGQKGMPQFLDLHTRFLQELWEGAPCERTSESVLDEVEQKWISAASHFDSEWKQLGQKALQEAAIGLRGSTLACGPSHGDFVPWNVKTYNDRLVVFDWESATWDKPRMWDMFHFHVQSALLLGRGYDDPMSWPRSGEQNALYLLYLLYSACRAFDEGHPNPIAVLARGKMLARALQHC